MGGGDINTIRQMLFQGRGVGSILCSDHDRTMNELQRDRRRVGVPRPSDLSAAVRSVW